MSPGLRGLLLDTTPLESALLAAVIGPGLTVVAGGLMCLAGVAAMGRWMPAFGRYVLDRPDAPAAAADPVPGPIR